mmetsp:Transcript_33005/g.77949  ORF Transcript_33005/g.77949 Transcript_33005/m.77949 type:complete len:170 (+) Transcript_33005:1569-2078(+)
MGAEKCPSKCYRQDAYDVLGAPAITNAGKGLRRCIHESIPWLRWGNHRLGAHTKSLGIAKLIVVLIRLSGDPTHRNKTFSRYGTRGRKQHQFLALRAQRYCSRRCSQLPSKMQGTKTLLEVELREWIASKPDSESLEGGTALYTRLSIGSYPTVTIDVNDRLHLIIRFF